MTEESPVNDFSSYRNEGFFHEPSSESSVDASFLDRLQTIDLTLMQLQEKLKALPALKTIKLAQIEKKKVAKRCLDLTGKIKDLKMETADFEATCTQIEEDRERLTQQIQNNPSDHRALANAELALSDLAKKRDKIDYVSAQVSSQLLVLQEEMNQLKKKDEQLTQALANAQLQVEQATTEMRSKVRGLHKERECLVSQLGVGLYDSYTEAQAQFKGLAVEKLEGSKPSVCRVELQTSALASLNEDDSAIQRCPYCRRILLIQKQ